MRRILPAIAMIGAGLALFGAGPSAQAADGLARPSLGPLVAQGEYMASRHRRGRRVGRRGGGNAAAGAAVAGIAGALIGGAIAAQQRRHYYDDGYYGGGPYGVYGPGPYEDPYW